MMGEDIEIILQSIYNDMHDNGYTAIVDFNQSPLGWFEKWMKTNHVRMDGSLLSLLNKYFDPVETSTHSAYLGMWSYFMFIGRQG
jgi:S-adenosylmethionine-diacylgycerolhomoserine-N-methlytransferase